MLVNMNDVLLPAKEKGYGVGFFNAVNVEMARAVIETAEELNAPVMVGTAEVLLPAMEIPPDSSGLRRTDILLFIIPHFPEITTVFCGDIWKNSKENRVLRSV